MIRSMTGFGVAAAEHAGRHYSVEVRSVNNRFFKSAVRVPVELGPLEGELEAALGRRTQRGSVTVSVRVAVTSRAVAAEIDVDVARALVERVVAALPPELAARATVDVASLLSLPAVAHNAETHAVEVARPILLRLLDEACDGMLAMRAAEGEALRRHLLGFGAVMRERLDLVRQRAPAVVRQYQERLRQRMVSLLAEIGASVRDEDLIREVAIFAERSDIAEEVVRLAGHLDQFDRILAPANGEPVGRTLDFLAQEMLREANTIASKSSDGDIARLIVEIKTAIDRLKEQAANAE
jgi:uncharacterized protein (TIGR00255 family)